MTGEKPLLGITMGDPAGIGSEIIVKAYPKIASSAHVVVVGDADVVREAVSLCESGLYVSEIDNVTDIEPTADAIAVFDLDNVVDLEYGALRQDYGAASLEYVKRAIELTMAGTVDAMVTAPINKQAIQLAGSEYAGHTGMLADYTDTENYSMMLIEGELCVTHVSTHVSLREACDLVTTDRVLSTIEVTDEALRNLGVDDPDIAVSGLNPHASDGGLLGDEDDAEIRPAVAEARDRGISVDGPESPDTVYVQAVRGQYDCVVSMYHDQGHIPIKMLGFQGDGAVSGVNMTIGLPIVRTSVDHGTAFDIAGEGIASPTSMVDACRVATEVLTNHD